LQERSGSQARSWEMRGQSVAGRSERLLAAGERPSEGVVVDLDADRAPIGRFHQGTHEPTPIHLAVSRDAWLVPLERMRENAHLVDPVAADLHVLGMEMEEFFLELTQWAGGIHLLEDEVRRVVVQPEVAAGDVAEHA